MSKVAEAFNPEAYGATPGYKEPTTSRDAAIKMRSRAATLRERVFSAIEAAPAGLTADEAAAAVGESILAVRPRVTELKREGRIVRAHSTRRNASGINAAVWIVKR